MVLSYSKVTGHSTLEKGAAKLSKNFGLNPRTLKTSVATLRKYEKSQEYSSMVDRLSEMARLGDPHFESSPEVPAMAEIFQSC